MDDVADIQNQATADTDFLTLKLSGVRFVDNGNGTVTDVQTGLMWEQKDDSGGVHDVDNTYTWSASGTVPDGTAYTTFLGDLNNCEDDGTRPPSGSSGLSGGFAGYCDWRLPDIVELQTIVDLTQPGCGGGSPCIDPIFGPTAADTGDFYWSSTGDSLFSTSAWLVTFDVGAVGGGLGKFGPFYVRAVRGGW